MARIRSIKPSLFESGTVAKLSIPARYTLVGLILEADDEGRFLYSPKKLAGSLFPHDEGISPGKVDSWLAEIEAIGTIREYVVEGIRYGFFPCWESHQKISHPAPSRLPNPSGNPPENFRSDSGATPEILRPEVEVGSRKGNRKSELLAEFERFWRIYPRREARAGALSKFERLVRGGVDPAVIVAGAERYAAHVQRHQTERRFVKLPTTWLNNGCWDDEYDSGPSRPPTPEEIEADIAAFLAEGRS